MNNEKVKFYYFQTFTFTREISGERIRKTIFFPSIRFHLKAQSNPINGTYEKIPFFPGCMKRLGKPIKIRIKGDLK